MEEKALPVPLREFMIKCWRRHRDVPTRIDQLVDRAVVEDLLYRKQSLRTRMTRNKIDGQSLVKVEHLLHSCFEATQNLPEDSHANVGKLKEKIKKIKNEQEQLETKFANTQLRFVALHKKGRLGVAGTPNWEWAQSEVDRRLEVLAETSQSQIPQEPTLQQDNVEWVKCVLCSKWRILPRGVEPTSLPEDWSCSAGATWRATGLTCDVEADVYNEDDICGEEDDRSDEDNASEASQSQIREAGTKRKDKVAWVECVLCSKWRILPRGVEPKTLPDDWNCSAGATWRTTGLTCDVKDDVEEDVWNEDDISGEDDRSDEDNAT
jgi:hypothetical protein